VRDLVVFAQHSLLKDPPFSHIDRVSCRNLMIYLDRDLQRQVCATFHYALRTNGYLFVDSSESIERQSLFRTINRDARIFQAMERPRELPPLPRVITGPRITQIPALAGSYRESKASYGVEHRQALEVSAPPSMLVDEGQRICMCPTRLDGSCSSREVRFQRQRLISCDQSSSSIYRLPCTARSSRSYQR